MFCIKREGGWGEWLYYLNNFPATIWLNKQKKDKKIKKKPSLWMWICGQYHFDYRFPSTVSPTKARVRRTPGSSLTSENRSLKSVFTPWRLPLLRGNRASDAKRLSAACWNGLNRGEWSPRARSANWCFRKSCPLRVRYHCRLPVGLHLVWTKKNPTFCFSGTV